MHRDNTHLGLIRFRGYVPKGVEFTVTACCHALRVSPSGF